MTWGSVSKDSSSSPVSLQTLNVQRNRVNTVQGHVTVWRVRSRSRTGQTSIHGLREDPIPCLAAFCQDWVTTGEVIAEDFAWLIEMF